VFPSWDFRFGKVGFVGFKCFRFAELCGERDGHEGSARCRVSQQE
jgi:hypothetical protein